MIIAIMHVKEFLKYDRDSNNLLYLSLQEFCDRAEEILKSCAHLVDEVLMQGNGISENAERSFLQERPSATMCNFVALATDSRKLTSSGQEIQADINGKTSLDGQNGLF